MTREAIETVLRGGLRTCGKFVAYPIARIATGRSHAQNGGVLPNSAFLDSRMGICHGKVTMRTKLYTESLIIPGDSAEHKAPAFPRSSSVNDEPDRVLELNRKACEAIWELWQISNKTGTSEKQRAQAELAKQCLKVLESFAHDPGRTKRKPGDSATAQQNRDMLNALSMLADGKSMKEISIELKPQIAHEKAIRYYSVRFKQFSIRLYNAVRLKYPRWGDESLSSLSGTYLTDAVDGWPGLQPTDAKALRKGLEIYFSKHPKLTKQQRLDTD